MLRLIDLLKLSGVVLNNYKIHCATENKESGWRPLEQFFAGTFEKGQSEQSQKNFECGHILSLISLGRNARWLFVGVYRVDGVQEAQGWNGFQYSLTRVSGLEHLEGRAVISFTKSFRASYLIGAKYENELIVDSIREERLSIADFPGFNRVLLSFEMLDCIIRQDNPSWRAALANIAGIYVIVDRTTGKQYVGSAYGGVGLWQRWSVYAKTKHGENKELRDLLDLKGHEHARHFQFSLVEMIDINASDEFIMSREVHWKNTLMTREFGLNSN